MVLAFCVPWNHDVFSLKTQVFFFSFVKERFPFQFFLTWDKLWKSVKQLCKIFAVFALKWHVFLVHLLPSLAVVNIIYVSETLVWSEGREVGGGKKKKIGSIDFFAAQFFHGVNSLLILGLYLCKNKQGSFFFCILELIAMKLHASNVVVTIICKDTLTVSQQSPLFSC